MSGTVPRRWLRQQLTYCANVHPGATLNQLEQVIRHHFSAVRSLRGLRTMGTGLWLSAAVTRKLHDDEAALQKFHRLLQQEGVELFTLNGFPYDDFHRKVVKTQVYEPDWSTGKRYRYTLQLAEILASSLPSCCQQGTISTLPLGYRAKWARARQASALENLCRLTEDLHNLEQQQGRSIRVCLEMEPGCVLERTEQLVELFTRQLPSMARKLGIPSKYIFRHLGACYDICHQAVMFEDPVRSLEQLQRAGIAIGKIQISNALELANPRMIDPEKLLSRFAEPKYLHQVRTRTGDGRLHAVEDLADAFSREQGLPRSHPWRIHFHVPIQAHTLADGALQTTQSSIHALLDHLRNTPSLTPHLEVETYTWQVLPPESRPADEDQLHAGLTAELEWLESEMDRRELIEQAGT